MWPTLADTKTLRFHLLQVPTQRKHVHLVTYSNEKYRPISPRLRADCRDVNLVDVCLLSERHIQCPYVIHVFHVHTWGGMFCVKPLASVVKLWSFGTIVQVLPCSCMDDCRCHCCSHFRSICSGYTIFIVLLTMWLGAMGITCCNCKFVIIINNKSCPHHVKRQRQTSEQVKMKVHVKSIAQRDSFIFCSSFHMMFVPGHFTWVKCRGFISIDQVTPPRNWVSASMAKNTIQAHHPVNLGWQTVVHHYLDQWQTLMKLS